MGIAFACFWWFEDGWVGLAWVWGELGFDVGALGFDLRRNSETHPSARGWIAQR